MQSDDERLRDRRHASQPGRGRPSGTLATMLAKIRSEMPLPTPRWVISSPSHITSVVPGHQRDDDQVEAARR